MTTSLLNASRNSNASRATRTQASGSSPLTWKIGAWTVRATSVAYVDDRLCGRRRREADLVVDDHVDRAAGAIAAELAQLEGLGDDALTGERGVAVHQDRQHREVEAAVEHVLLGAHDRPRGPGRPPRGATGSPRATPRSMPPIRGEAALGAQVVLHVARIRAPHQGRRCPRTRGRSGRRTCRRCWRAR